MSLTQQDVTGGGQGSDASGFRPSATSAERLWVAIAYWALRLGVAGEFVGHGIAGLYRPDAWRPYLELFGINGAQSQDSVMLVVGAIDITLGLSVLVRPMRAVLAWMALWGLFTAVLRPLAGESVFELVERGANYATPLALIVLAGWAGWAGRGGLAGWIGRPGWARRTAASWFASIPGPEHLSNRTAEAAGWVMRAGIFLLLVGHGGLGGLGLWDAKAEWFDFFAYLGVSASTVADLHLAAWVGYFEVALGLVVLLTPLRWVLVGVFIWKVGTELLRPLVGQTNYQFIERAGDYALPLALFALVSLGIRRRRLLVGLAARESRELAPVVGSRSDGAG